MQEFSVFVVGVEQGFILTVLNMAGCNNVLRAADGSSMPGTGEGCVMNSDVNGT